VLLTRVITAAVLVIILVGMLFFAPALAWSVFVLAIALAASWEWSRLCKLDPRSQAIYLALSGAMGAGFWLLYARGATTVFMAAASIAFLLSAAFWVLAAPWWLAKKARPDPLVCALSGWLVVWPTWFAFVVLRDASPWLLLAIAALVWIADIAAYFTGRKFGKRKLAPAVSPNKSWEGVYGGLAGVTVYGLLLNWIAHARPTPLSGIFEADHGLPVIAAMLVLAALSVVGDLFESWMKRGAGLKDSSALLPGHGGILDRIDSVLAALPVFALGKGLLGF
jgi:phosphatidate cytidylyltransferase